MKTFLKFILGIALCLTISTTFAQNITLDLVKFNSNQSITAIPVTSAQYSFSIVLNISSQSTGAGAGKAAFNPITITKQVDGSTADLQQALFTGTSYQYLRLNFYRADGGLAYRVVCGLAAVANYSASGAAGGCSSGCPALSETISFQYGQLATYDPTNGGKITTWNGQTNTINVSQTIPQSAITQ